MTECPADTGRASRRFPNSHSQMLHTKCPDKKITEDMGSERDTNVLKSNQGSGINKNTIKSQEQKLPVPVQSLSGDSDDIRKLESKAVVSQLSIVNPPCVPANSNVNKLLTMSSLLNAPATGAQEKEAQGEISNRVQDLLLPDKSSTIRNLMPLSSFQEPEQLHVSGHLDMGVIHTSACTGAHSVKSKSDILSLSEVNESSELVGRLVQDTTDKPEMKQIRSQSLDMILLRESILKKSLLSSHPNSALVSSKGFQHGPVINRKTMEPVENQVMEKKSEQVFWNEGQNGLRLNLDTAVNDVQYAAEWNNKTHLNAQTGNQGNPETSVRLEFSESNIMPNRPGNCSVLRLMGKNVVVNPVGNTPPHNPQSRGASRVESTEDELRLSLQQFHGTQHYSMFCQADVSNTSNRSMVSSRNENFAEFTPVNSSSYLLRSKPPVAANCKMQSVLQEKTTLASNLAYCPPPFPGFSVPDSSICPDCNCPMAPKLPQCRFKADQCTIRSNSVSARGQSLSRKHQNRPPKTFPFNAQKQKGNHSNDTVLRHNFQAGTATLNLMENRAQISKSTTAFATPNPLMSQVYGYSVGPETSGLMSSNILPSTNCLDTDIATFSDSKALQHHKQYRTKKQAAYCIGTHVGFQKNENIRDDALSEKEYYSGYKSLNQTWGESIGALKKSAAVTFHEREKQYPELIAPLMSNISAGRDGKLESFQLNFSGTVPNENINSDGVCMTNMNPAEVSASYQDDGLFFRDFAISGSSFPKRYNMGRLGNASQAGIPHNHQHLKICQRQKVPTEASKNDFSQNFSPQWNIVRQPEIEMDPSSSGLITPDSLTLLTGRGAMAIGVGKEGHAARKPHTFQDLLQGNGRGVSDEGSKSIKLDYKGEQDCVANNMSGHDTNNYSAEIMNIFDNNLHTEAIMFAQRNQNSIAQSPSLSDREASSHSPGMKGQ